MTKLDLLHFVGTYPYSHPKLKAALALDEDAETPIPSESSARETYYQQNHRLSRLIVQMNAKHPNSGPPDNLPTEAVLSSSGFVVHSIAAALYCFLSTKTFEAGAIVAANLGNDSDTVAAIYAGLAGVWYASTEDSTQNDLFWSKRVREWRKDLVREDLVSTAAEELIAKFAR